MAKKISKRRVKRIKKAKKRLAAPKVVRIGKYACVVCGRTAQGPVYCCGPLSKLHLPKKMATKR
jgi:rubrerythrin